MNEISTLATSEGHLKHAAFWKASIDRIESDFRLRPNWQSYALPLGPTPRLDFEIGSENEDFLHEMSRGNDLGVFVILLAAIFQVLQKYSGSDTVFVNSPCLINGPKSEYEGAVPLVAGAPFGISVRDHLTSTREIVAQSYSYQDFPIREFAESILKRTPRPTANVFVRFEGVHETSPRVGSYDFEIEIARTAAIELRLRANPEMFTTHYLRHFARHLRNVIAAYRNLDLRLDRIRLADEEERQRLTPAVDPVRVDGTIIEVFAERVKASPRSVAVSTEDCEIIYSHLDDRSTALAQLLRDEYGIKPGDTVGILADRSVNWVIAILGILKAGGIYLPLDPEYPETRLRFMIEDANVRALLLHSEHLPLLAEFWEIPMVALDLQLGSLEFGTPTATASPQPDDPAYVIYTSGSTGTPKGVVLRHRGLLNMVLHHIDAFGFTPDDRLVQFYSPSFDGSIMEVFVALLVGGRLALARPEVLRDTGLFSAFIRQQAVTTINAPPMYLKALDWGALDTVRRVISAGDAADVENVRLLARTRSVHNSYGPTEGTVCVTDYVVDPEIRYGARIPVGKPISNVRIYLLDEDLDLVPEGCVGEICISGVALALGYLNRQDLTDAAFVPNPFEPGERLYRSGDLGVWLPDGNLELRGRKDTQVKIRGYRIELGEIEAVLTTHQAVDEAVVTVREDNTGGKQLVACVAPQAVTADELRQYLKTRLPEFMVPAGFTMIDRMPLTRNGKLDRTALAAIPPASTKGHSHAEPSNAIQHRLTQIWTDVLGVEGIGIHDNFFELGGDSILILQILSRAQEAGIKITAQQHFDHPTIFGLSDVAVDCTTTRAEQGILTGPALFTPAQFWFFSQQIEDPHHYNQSAMIEAPAGLRPQVIERALEYVIEHHDALRLAFFPTGNGLWEQFYAPPPLTAPVRVTSVAGMTAAVRESVILEEADRLQTSFRLSEPPLLRAHLFQRDEGEPSWLLFIIHHLIIDGVSWRVLFEDFYRACCQIDAGQAVRLPIKTTSLREWAQRLTEYGRVESAGLDHWRETAAQARRSHTALPVDGTAATETASFKINIDREPTDALLHEVPKTLNAQTDEVLLTALVMTIRDWAGLTTVLVDLEGHGRDEIFTDADVSRTIGWFTALYPVLLYCATTATPEALLQSVKEQLRAIPLSRHGYGLARYVQEDPEVVAMPSAPILFNYMGQIDRILPDCPWKPVLRHNGSEHSPRARAAHLLEIEGVAFESQLHLTWTWNLGIFTASTIHRLAQRYRDNLVQLAELSSSPATQRLTTSDFPAAGLDQKSLDALVARIRS